jgi:hypothetical protein
MTKVIYNKIIPFKGFSAMAFVWWIFARQELTERVIRHEEIHIRQQKEMIVIFFLLWYGIEWLLRLIQYRNRMTAYKNISFERETYDNMSNIGYLNTRNAYSFIKYIKQ